MTKQDGHPTAFQNIPNIDCVVIVSSKQQATLEIKCEKFSNNHIRFIFPFYLAKSKILYIHILHADNLELIPAAPV